MNSKAGLFVAAALALSGGLKVSAETYDINYTGVVGDLTDTSGYFGTVDPGKTAFSATFIANFSEGFRYGDGGSDGGEQDLIGGSSYTNLPTMDGTAPSPVSAVLTVNGKTLYFAGQYQGIDEAIFNEDFAAPQPSVFVNNNQTATDQATDFDLNSDTISGYVSTSGPDYTSEGGGNPIDILPIDLTTPYHLAIDGSVLVGALNFNYSSFDALGGALINASGDFKPTEVQVSLASGAPEPSTWALLFAGVGLVGMAMRFHRRRTPLAS